LGNKTDGTDSIFSSVARQRGGRSAASAGNKVVIAVLGMAHCNGIKKLLMEKLVTVREDHVRELAPILSSSTMITATSPVNVVDNTSSEVIERQRNSSHSQ
jgi:hypothetical protein